MKQKIRQILYDMRHQRVISLITLAGTAMAVFLLMTVIMMQDVQTASFKPETRRERTVYSSGIHTKTPSIHQEQSSYPSFDVARELYGGLDGVAITSFTTLGGINMVSGPTGSPVEALCKDVDQNFWNIYEFDLLDGRYFTESEVESEAKVVVVTKSLAEAIFGHESPVGKEMTVLSQPHLVVGMVDDVPALARKAHGDFYKPLTESRYYTDGLFGQAEVAMLLEEGYPLQQVRDQVKARYAALETRLNVDNPDPIEVVYHMAPYDRYDNVGRRYSNTDPEPNAGRTMKLLLYAVLLIVPAVNLSSMTHSRLRTRISEIGVRRAFGCTRSRIIADIIVENFIVTLIGAAVGLLACIIFTSSYSSLLASLTTVGDDTSIPLDALINFRVFGIGLGVCLLLNIISASLPAWLASRVNPVEAINARKQ